VVLYAHYDGQPVSGAPWLGDPWTPALKARVDAPEVPLPADGDTVDRTLRVFARSASDDKGPIVALLAALDAMAASGHVPDVNLKVFLEGEEEAGSPHLGPLLRAHADRLRSDAWLFLDGPLHVSGAPQLVLGVRGSVGVEVTLYGPSRPLHSGHYGNWAPNPAARLAHLIAAMRAEDGTITIPGFHDDVRPPTDAERAAARALSATDDSVRASLRLAGHETLEPTIAEAIMRPALNVRGLRSGAVGSGTTNAVPTSASASIGFRLVPDQDPERLKRVVNAFIAARGYEIVTDESAATARDDRDRLALVRWSTGYRSVRAGMDAPVVGALRRVITATRGRAPFVAPTMGGSLPQFHFEDVFGVPLVSLPTVNSDNNQHAPDENLAVWALYDAIETFAATLATLGAAWEDAVRVP
jgi:acetylornithine deacetylase/succinyl-diaminopimelate desuccinylase-like protein